MTHFSPPPPPHFIVMYFMLLKDHILHLRLDKIFSKYKDSYMDKFIHGGAAEKKRNKQELCSMPVKERQIER